MNKRSFYKVNDLLPEYQEIKRLHQQFPKWGYRRLTAYLRSYDSEVSADYVMMALRQIRMETPAFKPKLIPSRPARGGEL